MKGISTAFPVEKGKSNVFKVSFRCWKMSQTVQTLLRWPHQHSEAYGFDCKLIFSCGADGCSSQWSVGVTGQRPSEDLQLYPRRQVSHSACGPNPQITVGRLFRYRSRDCFRFQTGSLKRADEHVGFSPDREAYQQLCRHTSDLMRRMSLRQPCGASLAPFVLKQNRLLL